MAILEVENLRKSFNELEVLKDISFSLERGEITGVIGANGSGKTTLLKALCGTLPHEGTCMLNGQHLAALSARSIARLISYIPQRSGIAIDLSALDVVLMGFNPQLKLLEQPTRSMHQKAQQALEQVGLGGREEENYQHLSEGQKQLCILARTLVSGCPLLLLDEPESALDFRHRYEMLTLLRRLTDASQTSALVTLHDPNLALNACDQLLLLHEGRVCSVLRPRQDPPEQMEQALRGIYGPVSLQRIPRRNGRPQLIMLKEDE